ncbi:MAG: preprotein translocase subunit SecY [Chloroflexota bacterium]
MLEALRNAFNLRDVRQRLLFTLGILVILRLAAHVPLPNVDVEAMRQVFEQNQLLGLFDLFSGGAMSNFSIMALGVYPYITATIILQLLTPLIPALSELSKEGEAGRNKLNQYYYFLTIPLAILQGFTQAQILSGSGGVISQWGLKAYPLPTLSTVLTLTAGTMLAVWLGELINEKGVGQGLSIIIFGNIVAQIPGQVGSLLVNDVPGLIFFTVILIVTVSVIVVVQEGQRRIPVQYGKRVLAMRGNRLRIAGGQSTHIPLRVNTAGMIPLIFASSFLIFPGVVAQFFVNSETTWVKSLAETLVRISNGQSDWYYLLYFLLVVGLTYFYTDVIFQQQNLPESLQRQGGFIPGIRPGRRTADYLNGVMQRITLVGAFFLGGVAILPWLVKLTGLVQNPGQMLITSSGLLIVVGVVRDTMKQLEAQLLMRHYEGFIRR